MPGNIRTLGIIAGGGTLPAYLAARCVEMGIMPFLVGFKGETDDALMQAHAHIWVHVGEIGKIIKYFKANEARDLVMIGSMKRPSFSEIKPDMKAVRILARIGTKALGDDGLLSVLKKELEHEGFRVHGIHKFCDELLLKEGAVGRFNAHKNDFSNIQFGLSVARQIGALDIGQSVIVQDGRVLGIEAVEGTDGLIERCATLQKKGRGAILVKTCKPHQDKDLDLPTVGPQTVEKAHQAGLSGIALQAGETLIVDSKEVARLANTYKMFVCGVSLPAETS